MFKIRLFSLAIFLSICCLGVRVVDIYASLTTSPAPHTDETASQDTHIAHQRDPLESHAVKALVSIFKKMKPQIAAKFLLEMDSTVMMMVLPQLPTEKVTAIMSSLDPQSMEKFQDMWRRMIPSQT